MLIFGDKVHLVPLHFGHRADHFLFSSLVKNFSLSPLSHIVSAWDLWTCSHFCLNVSPSLLISVISDHPSRLHLHASYCFSSKNSFSLGQGPLLVLTMPQACPIIAFITLFVTMYYLSLFPPHADLHEVREWDNLVHRSPVQLLAHCTLLTLCKNQSFNEWINQMWYLPKVKRFQTFKDRNSDTCHNTGEPWGQYAKWNRPFTK